MVISAQPVGAHFNYLGTTSNAPASINLPLEFEGDLVAETSSMAPATVRVADPEAEDPTGQGKTRTVVAHGVTKSTLRSSVWWGDENDHEVFGDVAIYSRNAPVAIVV